MTVALNVAQVIRRVRQRLGLSQEALARLLNATDGAIKHGRHRPNLARLLALQQLCQRGRERTQLDALIRQTQARVAPLGGRGGDRGSAGSSDDSRPDWRFARFFQ